MRERDIRTALKSTISAPLVLDELGLRCGSVRADVVTVGDSLDGYEIKSDGDTLARLPAQAEAYSAVFDRCTLVCAPKHLPGGRRMVPAWWGLVVADGGLEPVRPALPNPSIRPDVLAQLLWRAEAAAILKPLGCPGTRPMPRARLWAEIVARVSVDELRGHVRAALLARGDWMGRQRSERAEADARERRRQEANEAGLAWLLSLVP